MYDVTAPETGIRRDLRSKLVDGIAPALILYLLTATLILLINPFFALFGRPGLLTYGLGIMALSIYCMERSLVQSFSEPHRAWYGIVGGILGWIVVEVSNQVGGVRVFSLAGALTWILFGLIIATLWRRRILPAGAKFYSAAMLLCYTWHLFLDAMTRTEALNPAFQLFTPITIVTAVICLLAVVGWLFSRTEWRIERLWCALFIWFFMLVSMYGLRGGLF
jgi:hypothetical protein